MDTQCIQINTRTYIIHKPQHNTDNNNTLNADNNLNTIFKQYMQQQTHIGKHKQLFGKVSTSIKTPYGKLCLRRSHFSEKI